MFCWVFFPEKRTKKDCPALPDLRPREMYVVRPRIFRFAVFRNLTAGWCGESGPTNWCGVSSNRCENGKLVDEPHTSKSSSLERPCCPQPYRHPDGRHFSSRSFGPDAFFRRHGITDAPHETTPASTVHSSGGGGAASGGSEPRPPRGSLLLLVTNLLVVVMAACRLQSPFVTTVVPLR